MKKPEIYISYAWEKQADGSNWSPIIKNLYNALSNEGYKIKIDIHSINYKESIKSFMNELGRGLYVVAIISEKYLKSTNCMYEVLQMIKYPNFRTRIFPILMDETKIYESKKILEYLKYWDSEITYLNQEAKTLSNMVYARPIFEDIELMNEIRRIIASFGSTIGDMNVLNPHEHNNTNFNILIKSINQKFEEDNQKMTIEHQNKELFDKNIELLAELELLKSENKKLKTEINKKDEVIQKLTKEEIISDINEIKQEEKTNSSILIFENILGFSRDSTKIDIIKKLGNPTSEDNSKKYNFNTIYYDDLLSFSYDKKSKKLCTVDISLLFSPPQIIIDYLNNKGIVDKKIKYLGMHKDKILEDFGTPTDITAGFYIFRSENFQLNFICYDRDEYKCSNIIVRFF